MELKFKKRKKTNFYSVTTIRKKFKTDSGTVYVNKEAVIGAINGEMSHEQILEIFTKIGINAPSQKPFSKLEKKLCRIG